MTRKPKLIVYYSPSLRDLNWVAYIEGREEQQEQGWGKTAQDAIRDYKMNYDNDTWKDKIINWISKLFI